MKLYPRTRILGAHFLYLRCPLPKGEKVVVIGATVAFQTFVRLHLYALVKERF